MAKTKPTYASVDAFIDAVPHPVRREDARAVLAMMARVTGEPPVMWGPSIIGFGSYAYRYHSGHSGAACRLGFSPRRSELVLYVLTGDAAEGALLARLGKHRTGKACLYIAKLAEIDLDVLEALIANAWAWMSRRYPA